MFCFDKSRRLLKKSDYDVVFSDAQRWVNSDFIVLYRANALGHARLGLAISKKMVAKAHDRNRLKRLMRETFRQHRLPAFDLIVLAKKGVSEKQNHAILDKLGPLWDKLCEK
ncbi:MAG: ribonuclease P protein component [Legionellales bacterium]|nr:ribonuclease P protein component [Legionellales bacterium]